MYIISGKATNIKKLITRSSLSRNEISDTLEKYIALFYMVFLMVTFGFI